MRLRTTFFVGALALTTLAIAALDGFTIKSKVKVGDSHKYKQTGKFDFGGTDFEFSATSVMKVVKVDDKTGGWTTKEEVSEVKFNGEDAPEGSGPGGSTTTYSPKGEVTLIEGDGVDGSYYRFATFAQFIFPDNDVKAGDSWSYDTKADDKKGSVAAHATYTLVGEDKIGAIDTYKVKFTVKETGADAASSDGTVWVSKADGSLVKYATKWTNVPVPKAPMPISGEVTLTLVP